jgi:phosphoadenosine phosphosulfate reductase
MSGTAAHAAAARVGAPSAVRLDDLVERFRDADAVTLLQGVIGDVFPGRIALVSSFGVEAAVLLHLVARVDPATPVVFLDTGKLFGETLRHRDALTRLLGLTDVRTVQPDPQRIDQLDADGVLWYGKPDTCCHLRKVEPLRRALMGFDAWITGRKGFHGGERAALPALEATDDGRIRVNPLTSWSRSDVQAYAEAHHLPPHPLAADGFLSVGCMPCTDRVRPGEDVRAGRWRGREKTECGIHLPAGRWRVMGID